MATTVTYKGQTLATVENQTKTLQTAGTWVEDDFTLTDVTQGGGGVTLEDVMTRQVTDLETNYNFTGGMVISNKISNSMVFKNLLQAPSGGSYTAKVLAFPDATTVSSWNTFNDNQVQYIALPKCNSPQSYKFSGMNIAKVIDIGLDNNIKDNTFRNCTNLEVIIMRKSDAIQTLSNATNVFAGSPFESGGAGATIYIPKALYDHLGDGTALDYKSATNWSTMDSYGTITWAQLEGSQFESATDWWEAFI